MDDGENMPAELTLPAIIVGDLGMTGWLALADGTVLVDYRYVIELQQKNTGFNLVFAPGQMERI